MRTVSGGPRFLVPTDRIVRVFITTSWALAVFRDHRRRLGRRHASHHLRQSDANTPKGSEISEAFSRWGFS